MRRAIGLVHFRSVEGRNETPLARSKMAAFLLGLTLVFQFAGFEASAKDGRDFAGFYDLASITDLGDQVRFDFKLQVFNYSGTDLSNATITLRDSLPPGSVYATFGNVSMASNESVTQSQTVTVPKREYEQWRQGAQPNVIIWFRDSTNQNREQPVELLRQPGK